MLNEYPSLKHLTRSSFGDEGLEEKGCSCSRNRFTNESCCQTSIRNWWVLAVVVAFLTIGSISILLLIPVRFEARNKQRMTNESDKSYLDTSVTGKEKRTYYSDSINMLSPKTNLLSENYKESTMDLDKSARGKRSRRNTNSYPNTIRVSLVAYGANKHRWPRFLTLTDGGIVQAPLLNNHEPTIFHLTTWEAGSNHSLEHINNPKEYIRGEWRETRKLTKCGKTLIKLCLEHSRQQQPIASPYFRLITEPEKKFSICFELKGGPKYVHVQGDDGVVELRSNSSKRTIFDIKHIPY